LIKNEDNLLSIWDEKAIQCISIWWCMGSSWRSKSLCSFLHLFLKKKNTHQLFGYNKSVFTTKYTLEYNRLLPIFSKHTTRGPCDVPLYRWNTNKGISCFKMNHVQKRTWKQPILFNNALLTCLIFIFYTLYCKSINDDCSMSNRMKNNNKRAHRALGRSPEENVKGQGEAIYRGPLMLSTKYW